MSVIKEMCLKIWPSRPTFQSHSRSSEPT